MEFYLFDTREVEDKNLFIFSQEKFLRTVYERVKQGNRFSKFRFRSCYFNILSPYKHEASKKHSSKQDAALDDDAFFVFKAQYREKKLIKAMVYKLDVVDKFDEEPSYDSEAKFNGGNFNDFSVIERINNNTYIIPPMCRFYNNDVTEITQHIQGKFDLIIMDPPWWNKFIRRKRTRRCTDAMMWNKDLADIPLGSYLDDEGLVAVWCTNSKTHLDALKKDLFPTWGLKFMAQWFWLKVSKNAEPITPFSPPNGKQPFERILIGGRADRNMPIPQDKKIFISVPSIIHSQKPPLVESFRPYIRDNPRGLEIFARYLLPNFTSYGNEVLKLQHLNYYAKRDFCNTPDLGHAVEHEEE